MSTLQVQIPDNAHLGMLDSALRYLLNDRVTHLLPPGERPIDEVKIVHDVGVVTVTLVYPENGEGL